MKVVLTGEGADEVFGGYNIFREAKARLFWARDPGSDMRPGLLSLLYPYIFNTSQSHRIVRGHFGRHLSDIDDPLYSHRLRWENSGTIGRYLDDGFRDTLGDYDCMADVASRLPESFGSRSWFEKAQYLEMTLFMSGYLLSSQGDRVAMAHSVEIRLPFLDHRLIELMAEVPDHYKIRAMREKWLLKETYRDILPRGIVSREKQPFRAPIFPALTTGGNRDYLTADCLKESGIFDPQRVAMLISKLESGRRASETEYMALMGIITTQQVFSHFISSRYEGTDNDIAIDCMYDVRTVGATGKRNKSGFVIRSSK